MKRKNLSEQLKQKLIEKSVQRKLESAQDDSQGLLEKLTLSGSQRRSRFVDFSRHPAHQQISIMREGAQRLGVKDPFFRVHEGCAGATTRIDGRECINFASYNYLGLSGDPRVSQAAIEAVERYGTSVSASRMVAGERPIHQALEREIADTYGVDDAVAFVSGHATNVSSIGFLMGPKDLILHDEYIHNSSVVGAQLAGSKRIAFRHNDMRSLADILEAQRPHFERVLIIVEGLYSMDGDFPDLPELVSLKNRYDAWLMVDEAHSFGVMGATGMGLREHFALPGHAVDIWMGTFSKSLAGCGGYIAGCQALVDMLKTLSPGFLYSVGLPAQVAAPVLASLQILRQEPERIVKLKLISDYFLEKAKMKGFDTGHSLGWAVVPILTGSSLKAGQLSVELFDRGINVQPILYPAVPEKSARLRFFLSAQHNYDQIDYTLNSLSKIWQ